MRPFVLFLNFDMQLGDILRVIGVALLVAFLVLILKNMKSEAASLLRVGGLVVLLCGAILLLSEILTEFRSLIFFDEAERYVGIMTRALGLALVSQIGGDICRDMGETSVGSVVELCGRVAILSLCLPLISELMEYARTLAEL